MFGISGKPDDPTQFSAREALGILLPIAGVLVFVSGWCFLMFESGHARKDPIHETDVGGTRERYAQSPAKTLTRQGASFFSVWLLGGTALTVLGLLVARKQFTMFVLLVIAFMAGAAGALPFLFLKQ